MFKSVEKAYKKGISNVNEDDYIVDNNNLLFAVIDGATGLGGLSGKLASSTIKEGLIEEKQGSLLDKTKYANTLLGERTLDLTKKKSVTELPKQQRSSCGIAAIQINIEKNQLEYVHAGDCMLFIQYSDGTIRSMTHDHLYPFDSIAIKEFERILKTNLMDVSNVSIEQAKELLDQKRIEIMDLLRENRSKLNTLGGYGILDGSEEATDFTEYGIVSLNRIQKILLLSDGLQIPSSSWIETAQVVFDNTLDYLLKHVIELENNDPLCLTYPRLKIADDKTGILLVL